MDDKKKDIDCGSNDKASNQKNYEIIIRHSTPAHHRFAYFFSKCLQEKAENGEISVNDALVQELIRGIEEQDCETAQEGGDNNEV